VNLNPAPFRRGGKKRAPANSKAGAPGRDRLREESLCGLILKEGGIPHPLKRVQNDKSLRDTYPGMGSRRARQSLNEFELLGAALFTFFVKGADF
jgi:hypothetical protein